MPAAAKAGKVEGSGIDDRGITADQVGHQMAGAGADPETVAGEAAGDEKARQRRNRGYHRYGIWRDVDHPRPALGDHQVLEGRKGAHEVPPSFLQAREKTGARKYRQYRGREIPAYVPPPGMGLINKMKGEPRWAA